MEKEKKYPIYIILFFVMVAWGFNVVGTKVLVSVFPPVTITSFRIFTAGIAAFIILAFIKKVRLPSKREFKFILIAAIFNVFAHQYFLSMGLTVASATNAGLILGLSPLLTTLFAWMFLGSRITTIRMIGITSGLLGVFFIVLNKGSFSSISTGDIYVFLSVVTIAISFIMIKKVSNTLDPRLMTAYMLIIGSVLLFFLSLFLEPTGLQQMSQETGFIWLLFFASAVISTALGHMFYNYGIGKVGAAEASIFTNLNPFFAIVGGAVFLKEIITMNQITGFIFIIIGVILASGAYEEIQNSRKRKQAMAV
ncbi:drug/metabolite transporter (DMT)-like permease [Bacillus mesophilus]|uniref:DMT family transporter n=1 Tax=Bacillus mesophilus TaxID=1808955 RepID=A0A6M0Q9B6_9BACI|nr:DMT family transporter [Bacillus mesophilus]MBM7662540.1 drug/metabolite transporter (DMT)-like permease [Bacillus mesophilus]NEY72837.1 DMT family transporter [Bacillus mesophilus]